MLWLLACMYVSTGMEVHSLYIRCRNIFPYSFNTQYFNTMIINYVILTQYFLRPMFKCG